MGKLRLSTESKGRLDAAGMGMAQHGGSIGEFLDLMAYRGIDRELAGNGIALWLQRGRGEVEPFLDGDGYTAREVRFIVRTAIQQFERAGDCKGLA